MSAIDFINFRKLNEHFGLCRSAIRKEKIPKRYKTQIKELEDLINYWIKRNEKSIRPIREERTSIDVREPDVGSGIQPTVHASGTGEVVSAAS